MQNTNRIRYINRFEQSSWRSNIWVSSFSDVKSDSDMSNDSFYALSHLVNSNSSVQDDISDFNQVLEDCTATRNLDRVLSEGVFIEHLCNCNNIDLDWCFIHQKVNCIEPNDKQNDFRFGPLNTIEVPLLKPPKF